MFYVVKFFDGFLVANEVMDLEKMETNEIMLLKVDFEKACDSVIWNYLRYMLNILEFSAKWIAWMEACVFTSSMSVLVNKSATKDFKVGRGLRERITCLHFYLCFLWKA